MTSEARKKSTRLYQQRLFKRRNSLLAVFPCIACGEPDPDIIEWHHVHPETKKTQVGGTTIAEERWWDEVLKCVPLCCNCHRKVHKYKLCLLTQKILKNK